MHSFLPISHAAGARFHLFFLFFFFSLLFFHDRCTFVFTSYSYYFSFFFSLVFFLLLFALSQCNVMEWCPLQSQWQRSSAHRLPHLLPHQLARPLAHHHHQLPCL